MSFHGDSAKDEKDIRRLLEDWATAISHENVEEILAAHDPQVLTFPMPQPMQLKGIDDYRASWTAYFKWFENKQVFGLNELTVTAGSDIAFATALVSCVGITYRNRDEELAMRLTVGLRKQNELWRIVHVHLSRPFSKHPIGLQPESLAGAHQH